MTTAHAQAVSRHAAPAFVWSGHVNARRVLRQDCISASLLPWRRQWQLRLLNVYILEVSTVNKIRLSPSKATAFWKTLSASSVNGDAPGSQTGLISWDVSHWFGAGGSFIFRLYYGFSTLIKKGYHDWKSNPNPIILKLSSRAVSDPVVRGRDGGRWSNQQRISSNCRALMYIIYKQIISFPVLRIIGTYHPTQFQPSWLCSLKCCLDKKDFSIFNPAPPFIVSEMKCFQHESKSGKPLDKFGLKQRTYQLQIWQLQKKKKIRGKNRIQKSFWSWLLMPLVSATRWL